MKVALDMVPRTLSECRSFIGAILYAHTAFNLDVNEMYFFANKMSPMHATVTACAVNRETKKCANKFVWTEECEEARQTLIAAIEVVPRYFTHDLSLIKSGEHSTSLYVCNTNNRILTLTLTLTHFLCV